MSVERINPEALPRPDGFVHLTVGRGSRLVCIAGQVAIDKRGQLVGGDDLAAQTERALLNVAAALDAAGCGFDDIAKATLYVVDWHESKIEQLIAGVQRAAGEVGSEFLTATTLVPVARLFEPGYLIEIDITAVAD